MEKTETKNAVAPAAAPEPAAGGGRPAAARQRTRVVETEDALKGSDFGEAVITSRLNAA